MGKDPEIILMVGISGSGKSTTVPEYLTKGYTTVSRDNIRMLLFGYTPEDISEYYTRAGIKYREDLVSRVQDKIIRECLKNGGKVVVDNTHLKMKYIRSYDKYGKTVNLHIVDTPLEVCIERDKNRVASVGEEVIRRQHGNFLTLQKQLFDND